MNNKLDNVADAINITICQAGGYFENLLRTEFIDRTPAVNGTPELCFLI
ncbi:TPA: hypothetical protein SHY07_001000 [Escherichia coli]|uniref:Uncharacterized protein n=1 Tax=Salmonella enterica TaxID=28901 RepID=A0A764WUJ8_SALER|nr:hypothetical protein [Escherichia coli]HAG5111386.1 hypothetical protein [Salmonella enterica]EFA5471840.1 hypothetical protein [Escherichia coli]EFA5495592.1 hypothetical protein [Escherichia coli]EFA5505390.1 hypothetical protein [Escherichia coli]